ncbi:hypothetical protein [Streptomyces sp. CC224B]|uniref:hypothetical protein n=1 Tax=Streptomyces sp. CC224B TaxID=3044571 RepID=UPI0024A87F77|nr:hypothetical protein [Streptomyces sp. CC224B]
MDDFADPACRAVAIVFSEGWSWACFAFMVGYLRRSRLEATLLSSSALTAGAVVYYLSKFLDPAVPDGARVVSQGSTDELVTKIVFWGVAALILGAPVGFAGNLARISGPAGLPFRLVIPLIAFYETSDRLGTEIDSHDLVGQVTLNGIRVVAGAAAVALAWHTARAWRRARRGSPEAAQNSEQQ